MSKYTPVHPKVKAATAGAVGGTVVAEAVVQGVDALFYNGSAAPPVPGLIVQLVFLVVPAAVAFACGWIKKSTGIDVELGGDEPS